MTVSNNALNATENALPETTCALCRKQGPLRLSHILPAFVFRWLKETSITPYIRAAENPRKRVQDGLKRKLLCEACEGLFSNWETSFANLVFHPYTANEAIRVRYGAWMMKFCISISWRVLTFFLLEDGLRSWTEEERAQARNALERWRATLLGECEHPGPYEQHLLPLSAIESTTHPNLPKNMNRYLMRGIEMDAGSGKHITITYAKMGRFALFGIVRPAVERWVGTRVAVKSGIIHPTEYSLPPEVGGYLLERARKSAALVDAIPSHQLDKLEDTVMDNIKRGMGRDAISAMLLDSQMFGPGAVLRK